MPSPIPAPLPPWARALLQVAPLIAEGLQSALEYIGEMNTVDDTEPHEWRRCSFKWHQPADPDPANVVMTSIDVVNITGGTIDSTWTAADYTTVDAHMANIAGAWSQRQWQPWTHFERTYHRMQFNPLLNSKPFAPTGPPEKVYPVNTPGILSAVQAPQVAATHTELTAYRKHWGRSYWPCPSSSQMALDGHLGTPLVDAFGTGIANEYAALQAAEFFPVVVVTQVQGLPARGLLTVTDVQVDNVPDVIRRRRPHTTTHRARLGRSGMSLTGGGSAPRTFPGDASVLA